MKITRSFWGLLLALPVCAAAASAVAASGKSETIDPVFGLRYDTAAVHYETMPGQLRQICKDFKPAQAYWLYAHIKQGSADFYIVNTLPDESYGTVVRIEGADCSEADFGNTYTAYVPAAGYSETAETSPMPGDEPNVQTEGEVAGNFHYVLRFASEEAVLRGLIQDATKRGEKAWGAQAFRQKICPEDDTSRDKYVPLLVDEIRKYCKT